MDLRRLSLYIGGLMGPLGTMIVVPIFPELREHYDVGNEAVGLALTVYFLPFAAMLLFSGTIGERYGRGRVVQMTMWAYALSSFLCVLAPTWELFLAGRAAQGLANAFITPLLIAGLADLTPPEGLGAAVGRYSSFQAGGATLAPLIGGLAGDVDWRLAFAATGVVALLLSTQRPPGEPRPGADAPELRSLLTGRVVLIGTMALLAAAGPVGMAFLVSLELRDTLGVDASTAGLVLMVGTGAATVLGPLWGSAVQRYGSTAVGVIGLAASGVVALAVGWAPSLWPVTLAWIAGGALGGLIAVVFQNEAAVAVPRNRGGALSAVLAFRFTGHAIGPAVFTPMFAELPDLVFAATAALVVPAVVALVAARRFAPTPVVASVAG